MKEPVDRRARLLIVDDDNTFRIATKSLLTEEGFTVDDASRGEEAVRLAREHTYDLILLDIHMPLMDGIQVLKLLKPELPNTDFIMITAFQDTQLAVESMKHGAREYITKPVDPGDLVQRIRSASRAHDAELRVKSLQTEFSSRILHDLRTPLNTMRSAIGFLGKQIPGPLTQEQRDVLSDMERNIQKLDTILNDMIDLTLFESGQVELLRLPTNIDELVPAVCARLKPHAQAKQITLTSRADSNVPTIEADPEKIEQVLTNLIENGINYTNTGGTITVSLATARRTLDGKEQEFVETTIRDSGVGIASDELPFVFDKYKEVLTGKTSPMKTSGLSLAICKSIVEAHRGTITAESVPGSGSVFRFSLPV